jgi:hypothetical protein
MLCKVIEDADSGYIRTCLYKSKSDQRCPFTSGELQIPYPKRGQRNLSNEENTVNAQVESGLTIINII